jgi:pteridine reductase
VTLELRGKTALVTGAGTRLGSAIALGLARAGANLIVHYHSHRAGAERVVGDCQALGVEAIAVSGDLSDATIPADLVARTLERFQRLDVLVPSAANFERIAIDQVDGAAWDRALNLNAKAGFLLAQAARMELRARAGNIVFITCNSTVLPYKNYLPYVVSKAATLQLMRTLALEFAPEVRVNAVAPGTVLPPEDMPSTTLEQLRSKIPLKRLGAAEHVADAVVYLASAPFITGHQLMVDGGRSIAG